MNRYDGLRSLFQEGSSPGNDNNHPRHVGENLARVLPNAEAHHVMTKHHDLDLWPREERDEKEGHMATLFGAFIKRVGAIREPGHL